MSGSHGLRGQAGSPALRGGSIPPASPEAGAAGAHGGCHVLARWQGGVRGTLAPS